MTCNNIAKYANATEVDSKVTYKASQLLLVLLVVKDNGKGFDVEKANNGNGKYAKACRKAKSEV